jgi:hypothetical protein
LEFIDLIEDDNDNENKKINYSLNKWCKDNFINAKRMAKVRNISKQLYQTLLKAIQPKRHFQNNISKAEKLDKSIIDDIDSFIDELDPNFNAELVPSSKIHKKSAKKSPKKLPKKTVKTKNKTSKKASHKTKYKTKTSHKGGFMRAIKKNEEFEKLEPNVKRFQTEDENIMMSLAIGNFVNFAIKLQNQKDVYVSCFAKNKKFCKMNNDTFLLGTPKIVMYDEIFMSSENARFLKLNMVNKLPDTVWQRIKTNYKNYIKYCV